MTQPGNPVGHYKHAAPDGVGAGVILGSYRKSLADEFTSATRRDRSGASIPALKRGIHGDVQPR